PAAVGDPRGRDGSEAAGGEERRAGHRHGHDLHDVGRSPCRRRRPWRALAARVQVDHRRSAEPDAVSFLLRPAVRADLPDIARLVRGLAEYERLENEFTAGEAEFDRLLFAPDRVAEATLAEVPGQPPVGISLYYRTVNTFRGQIGLFLEDLFVEPA